MKKLDKKVLIAGATGVIGSHLSSFFKDKVDLTLLSLNKKDISKNYVSVNLCKNDEVDNFVCSGPKYDAIIFLVGLAHSKGKSKDFDAFESVNLKSLKNLINSFRKYDKIPDKIIYSSTISVYGENLQKNFYNENSLKSPSSPYARTKLDAEKFLIKDYFKKSWIIRLAPVYSSNFLLNIERRTKINGIFYRIGKGYTKLSLCNINNISSTIFEIINNKVPFGCYIISDRKEYSYNDLLLWKKAKHILRIPKIIIYFVYFSGKIIQNQFIVENSVKLLSDNIFSSDKISKYVELGSSLNNCKND